MRNAQWSYEWTQFNDDDNAAIKKKKNVNR